MAAMPWSAFQPGFHPARQGASKTGETMLKIYGQARSRAFRVLWLCKESNIAFEHVPVTIHVAGAQAKEDWYIKLNPNARVPTIDDDGFIMWESAAINLYLARKYKSPLWPSTPQGEGRAMQWGFFIANDLEKPMVTLFQQTVMVAADKRDPAVWKAAETDLISKLQVLENYLTAHKYFGVDRWDMADFMVASVTFTLTGMKYDLAKFPKFAAWLKEGMEREGCKEAVKMRG
jgi:glutathione S-transferase